MLSLVPAGAVSLPVFCLWSFWCGLWLSGRRDSDWQGARLAPGGEVALLGCTVSPGFDYADYETGTRAELTAQYPGAEEMIAALTRS